MRQLWPIHIINDWRWVLKRAWSVQALVLAMVFSGLEVALPFFDARLPVPEGWLAPIYFMITALAFLFRFLVQKRDGEV